MLENCHSIKNNFFEITVKNSGAELCSIKSQKTLHEFMWSGNPDVWASTSPVLFPIVGGLKNNSYCYKGNWYHLNRHGFIRNNQAVELTDKKNDRLTFVLRSNEQTIELYPFEFEFQISYQLIGNQIVVNNEVLNTGQHTMFFSVGAHPAFACPFFEGESYEDYFLEFEHKELAKTWLLDSNGQLNNETKMLLENSNVLPLKRNMFDNDALILKHLNSNKVSLKSKNHNKSITIDFNGFPFLGIWAKPGANYICLEPWCGIADYTNSNQELTEKEGIMSLESGKSFKVSYTIIIEE
jgi:galactose mutarotase-like enzyme